MFAQCKIDKYSDYNNAFKLSDFWLSMENQEVSVVPDAINLSPRKIFGTTYGLPYQKEFVDAVSKGNFNLAMKALEKIPFPPQGEVKECIEAYKTLGRGYRFLCSLVPRIGFD